MNVICITGNLCKDVEIKYTKNNKGFVENTLGVVKDKKREDGTKESDFIDFVAFEKKADYLSQYAKKGDKLEINGKLRVDTWQDDKGEYKTRTYVVADNVKILTARPKEIKEEEVPF